jgi:hypothetical protein
MLLVLLGLLGAPPDSVLDTVQVLVVSQRVGPEIGPAARNAFHMFPGISGFSSARFLHVPGSGIEVEVSSWQDDRTVLDRYPITAERLKRIGYYLDHYEEVVEQALRLREGAMPFLELWDGIGPRVTRLTEAPILIEKPGPMRRTAEAASCVGLGLGAGSCLGAMAATNYQYTRQESVWVWDWYGDCLMGAVALDTGQHGHWSYYTVDVYKVNQCLWAGIAGAGTALAGAGGYYAGDKLSLYGPRKALGSRVVEGYDLFGDPVLGSEVRAKMGSGYRSAGVILGGLGGGVLGAGAGLLLTSVARVLIFSNRRSGSVEVQGDGFTLDIALIAMTIGSAIRGGYEGYKHGEQQDWEQSLKDIRRRRIGTWVKDDR